MALSQSGLRGSGLGLRILRMGDSDQDLRVLARYKNNYFAERGPMVVLGGGRPLSPEQEDASSLGMLISRKYPPPHASRLPPWGQERDGVRAGGPTVGSEGGAVSYERGDPVTP